jgi:hypothetical protein
MVFFVFAFYFVTFHFSLLLFKDEGKDEGKEDEDEDEDEDDEG